MENEQEINLDQQEDVKPEKRNLDKIDNKNDNTHALKNYNTGILHASYLRGFVEPFTSLGLDKSSIENIIIAKMNVEFQLESLRMSIESNERLASLYGDRFQEEY